MVWYIVVLGKIDVSKKETKKGTKKTAEDTDIFVGQLRAAVGKHAYLRTIERKGPQVNSVKKEDKRKTKNKNKNVTPEEGNVTSANKNARRIVSSRHS